MFRCALLPISYHERRGRLVAMLHFLENFDTSRVVLLHVLGGPVTNEAQARLQALAGHLGEATGESTRSLRIDWVVRSGSPAYEIARTADEQAADFIYFPWKRKSWIQKALVGSTTKDVIRLTSLPIFVFRGSAASPGSGSAAVSGPPDAEGARDEFRVLYPTEFKVTDRYVIPYLQYAGLAADELILMSVRERAPDPTSDHRQEDWAESNLSRLASEVERNVKSITKLAMVGKPRRAIPRVARREKVELLVLGKSDKQNAVSAMMGSVAESVADRAPCSVFIVGREYQTSITAATVQP